MQLRRVVLLIVAILKFDTAQLAESGHSQVCLDKMPYCPKVTISGFA